MDKSSLIDFNNENYFKMSSPLIPAPNSTTAPRLSDIGNNPFDKLLKTIADKNDPFECCSNLSFDNNLNNNVSGKGENIGHLISPMRTPVKSNKLKKKSSSPLHISKYSVGEVKVFSSKQLSTISEIHNLSLDYKETDTSLFSINSTDASLQILSDSVLNNADELSNYFAIAYDLPLPYSPDDQINCSSNNNLKLEILIPSVVIQNESENIVDSHSTLNNANIDLRSENPRENLKNRLSTKSSEPSESNPNLNSLDVEIQEISDIRNVLPSISNDSESDNQLNKAFIEATSEPNILKQRCSSVRKSLSNFTSVTSTSKPTYLNNSFAGFTYNDRNIKFVNFRHSANWDEDSIFLEANKLSETFRISSYQDEIPECLHADINQCNPPWEEEIVDFLEDDNENTKKNNDNIKATQFSPVTNINSEIQVSKVESSNSDEKGSEFNKIEKKLEKQVRYDESGSDKTAFQNNESNVTDSTNIQNAKDLLHHLSAMLNNSGKEIDKRKFGENLINSLALALNIESPAACNKIEDNKPVNKLQRSKSDSKVSEKGRRSLVKQENKLSVPKIKSQSAAPVKLDKNLKVKNEKEKIATKGPLKALIPLTNMAKSKKNIGNKVSLPNTTPPKQTSQSFLHAKKISTPNELNIKSPIAQSTPDVSKNLRTDINNGSPGTKRHFGFSLSPLSRPASINDISNVCLNNSLSPSSTSDSTPNLNKSGANLSKNLSNSSIPTMKSLNRRNSASDMSTSRSSVLNRSYDSNQPVRPPVQLKRSSSFQNKCATDKKKNNDNKTLKKYGIPGTLKALRLVPKAKKSTAD